MKWIVGMLLLANLAIGSYFMWIKVESGLQVSQYAHAPLNADKITLQSVHLASGDVSNQSASKEVSEPICVEWRGLSEADLERGREAIKTLVAQRVLSVEEQPVNKMFWIIFPPLPSESAAKMKLLELKALKLNDVLLIREGVWKNGISLGLYGNEETLRGRLREIESVGVSGFRLETKPKKGTAYYYVIKSSDAAVLKELDTLRQSFPTTSIVRVACK